MRLPDGFHKDVVIVAENIAWRRWCLDFSDDDLASMIMSTAAICENGFNPTAAYGGHPDRADMESMTRMACMALELSQNNGWDPSSGETVEDFYNRMDNEAAGDYGAN